jgi:hypothetical protein
MPDNATKRIDELKVDEIVKSEKETSQIQAIDIHEGEFDLYSINGSKHFVTEDHPFQTTEGWKAITPNKTREKHQIEAFVLKVGDILIKDNGETEEILTLEKSEEKISTTTYNLMLDNEHVYYANNYLVHNGGVKRTIPKNLREKYVNPDQTPFGGPKDPIGKWTTGGPGTIPGSGGEGFACVVDTQGSGGFGGGGSCSQNQATINSTQCCIPPSQNLFTGTIQNTYTTKSACLAGCNVNLGENIIPQDVLESRKLRESFKNEFMPSSKVDKDEKLRKTIRRIIRKNKR